VGLVVVVAVARLVVEVLRTERGDERRAVRQGAVDLRIAKSATTSSP
jgi:hypothetical protein